MLIFTSRSTCFLFHCYGLQERLVHAGGQVRPKYVFWDASLGDSPVLTFFQRTEAINDFNAYT